jgi:hypothetical protein
LQADDGAMRLLVDGDSTSTTALRVAARRGGGDRGGGATAAALLSVAPRGSAAGARCVRQMASLQYVDVEAALGPDQVRTSLYIGQVAPSDSGTWRENKLPLYTAGSSHTPATEESTQVWESGQEKIK